MKIGINYINKLHKYIDNDINKKLLLLLNNQKFKDVFQNILEDELNINSNKINVKDTVTQSIEKLHKTLSNIDENNIDKNEGY